MEKKRVIDLDEKLHAEKSDYLLVENNDSTNKVTVENLLGDFEATTSKEITVLGVTLGNLKPGDVIPKGITLTEFIEMASTKEINPTYSAPSLSIAINKSGVFEHGEALSISITPTFKQNDAGAITKYVLKRNNVEILNSASCDVFRDSIDIVHGQNISYSATVSYGDGPIKNTNFGNPCATGQIKAGSKTATSATIYPVGASYYGVLDSDTPNETNIRGLNKTVKNSKGFTFNNVSANNQHIVYAYPSSFGRLTSIKDGNGFSYLDSYKVETITINSIEYYVYTLITATTVNGFTQIYS